MTWLKHHESAFLFFLYADGNCARQLFDGLLYGDVATGRFSQRSLGRPIFSLAVHGFDGRCLCGVLVEGVNREKNLLFIVCVDGDCLGKLPSRYGK